MPDADDQKLLTLCRIGSDEAWRKLVAKYQRLVYSVPMRNGLSEDEADDVFQATFVALHAQLNRIEQGAALPRWLVVVAARETYRVKRAAGKTVPLDNLVEQIASDDAAAEGEAMELSRADALRRGIERLAERCRHLLRRLYLDSASYDDIHAELGIPTGSIGPTRARCLEKLKRLLDPEIFSN